MWRADRIVVVAAACFFLWPMQSVMLAACNRRPQGASGDRSPVDENFKILIDGNPQTYITGQSYNVSLSCTNNLKFHSFTLTVETEAVAAAGSYDVLGRFLIVDTAETRYSSACENMVESTNTNTKTRIDIVWVAPTNPDSGCVLLKAALLQHRNVWFIDDGFLTKRLCPEEIDEINSQTPLVDTCCACDEAKYEIVLERQWTRNTHPKDFPSEGWRTRFSEIIGASHAHNYRFWDYGAPASTGLRNMAEHGATQELQEEIKQNLQSGEIRTIIKAPGVSYRLNAVSSTMATIRVDHVHHVISLVSKIYPSPDWILGVAGMELCLANCTWIERKLLNLYPWDAGTDAGPSYMSPDQPQVPPDVVRRITSTFPSDYRSPFYDDSGAPMKPLATLAITRKKIYDKPCGDEPEEDVPMECSAHPWNSWSECSAKCGPGQQQRQRQYKDAALADSYNCQLLLSQTQSCAGEQCGAAGSADSQERGGGGGGYGVSPECELTPWGAWSPCSKTCGKGLSVRTRNYINFSAREKCQSGIPLELHERRNCFGDQCGGAIPAASDNDEDDEQSPFRPFQHGANFNEPQTFEPPPAPYYPTNPRAEQPFHYNNNNQPRNYQPPAYGGRSTGVPSPLPPRYGAEQSLGNRFDNTPADNSYEPEPPAPSNWPNNRNNNERLYGAGGGNQEFGQQATPQSGDFHAERGGGAYSQQPHNFYGGGQRPGGYGATAGNNNNNNNYDVVQEFCFQLPIIRPCGRGSSVEIGNYWFYDASDRQCKLFTTDNCDDNKNKFRSLEACEGDCLRPQQNYEESYGLLPVLSAGGAANAERQRAARRRW